MNHIPASASDPQSDPRPDLARLLPREAFLEIIVVLRESLPAPGSGGAAARARRDRAALAAVASLLPETAAEGRVAAQFVVADAWALDCLRLARERRLEFNVTQKCRAQAASLMREAKSALRRLERMQAKRERTEGDETASVRAAWAEHSAVGMMQAGLEAQEDAAEEVAAADEATVGERKAAAAAEMRKFGFGTMDGMDASDTGFETQGRFGTPGEREPARPGD